MMEANQNRSGLGRFFECFVVEISADELPLLGLAAGDVAGVYMARSIALAAMHLLKIAGDLT